MSSLVEQITQLEAAIAAQEGLRPVLGDLAVNAIIAAARVQLDGLRAHANSDGVGQTPRDAPAERGTPSIEMLPAMGDEGARLEQQLETLQGADLIRQAAVDPELEYIFRHWLMQEATYGSILNSQRQVFHHQIGHVMEQLFASELDRQAATLAHHFQEAGDAARALRYFRLAGDYAFGRYANAEAIGHYSRALVIARRSGASSEQAAHLGTRLGRAYELTNDYTQALATYTAMEQLAAEKVDPPLRLAGLLAEAIAVGTPSAVHDPARANSLSLQALALARELADPAAEAKALWNLMQIGFWIGDDPQQAEIYGRESLAIARRHNLREQIGFTLVNLAGVYWGLGRFDAAQLMTDEARDIWQELNNVSMLGDAYNMSAWTKIFQGQLAGCLDDARAGRLISQRIDNAWNLAGGRQVEGWAYLHRGQLSEAVVSLESAVEHCKKAQISAADTLSFLAETYAMLGAGEQARDVIRQSLAEIEALAANFHPLTLSVLARAYLTLGLPLEAESVLGRTMSPEPSSGNMRWSHAPHVLARAELAVMQGRPAEAIGMLDGLIPFLKKTGLGIFLDDALALRGHALLAMQAWAPAAQALDEARSSALEHGARRSLWQIYAALAEAETAQGNAGEAERLRRLAREEVDYLAGNAGSEELRDAFLARPEIQRVQTPTAGG